MRRRRIPSCKISSLHLFRSSCTFSFLAVLFVNLDSFSRYQQNTIRTLMESGGGFQRHRPTLCRSYSPCLGFPTTLVNAALLCKRWLCKTSLRQMVMLAGADSLPWLCLSSLVCDMTQLPDDKIYLPSAQSDVVILDLEVTTISTIQLPPGLQACSMYLIHDPCQGAPHGGHLVAGG